MPDYQTKLKEHVNAHKNERKQANGISYIFVYEDDGWISIIEANPYRGLEPLIQASDLAHANEYIAMREIPNVNFTVI